MKNSSFVHLHLHTQSSYLDGFGSAKNYINQASKLGFEYLAITDHGNIDGSIDWQKECIDKNIKPIIGCELYVVPDMHKKEKNEKRGHLTVLVENINGWHTLCRWLTKANLEGHYHKPRCDYDQILNSNLDGLIFLTGCAASVINLPDSNRFMRDLFEKANKDSVFIEIMPHEIDVQKALHAKIKKKYNEWPLIASNDCFAEDTLILTTNGQKYIQDIKNGDLVYTHKNRFKSVTHTNKRNLLNTEKMFNLKTSIGSIVADVTESHPYHIASYNYLKKELYNFKWETVEKLNVNSDYLLVPKISKCDFISDTDNQFVDLLKYHTTKLINKSFIENNIEYVSIWRKDKNIKIPRYLKIDNDLLSIIGMYIANGCNDKYLFDISIHKSKYNLLCKAKKYFELFGLNPGLKINNNCARLVVSNSVFSNFFSKICGIHSHNKKFPKELKLSKDQTLKIMKSYITCDGHCGESLMIGATTSIKLIYDLSYILNCLGFLTLPKIQNNQEKNKNWRKLYCLTLSGQQAYEFSKLVKLDKKYKQPKRIIKRYIENEKFYGIKLIKKKEIDYNGYVYNFEVEEDNTYIANGYLVHNCHYILEEDWEAHEVLLAIQRGAKWNDPKRWKFSTKGFHLRTADEMMFAFRKQGDFERVEIRKALDRTLDVAKRCSSFRIEEQEISLPQLPYKISGMDEFDELKRSCDLGLIRFGKDKNANYKKRLETELSLIKKKNFERYFLIVQDFILFCKSKGWMIGPGRGSVGGSLIAHLLGITEGVDPIKYDLPFSRFLSENRTDWPDIDVDIEKRYRQQAVDALFEIYGKERVAYISTEMRMKSKAVIRDIGRVFDIPNDEISLMAKSIWDGEHEEGSAIESAIKNTRDAKEFNKKYPKIIKLALKLEGQFRGAGRHAAGIIISGDDLTDGKRCVLVKRGDYQVVNWNMKGCEHQGLIKIDVLGLSTLSVLAEAQELINGKESFAIEDIPEEDERSIKLIDEGKTAGLFQVSAKPLTELCKKMGVSNFKHIVAALSLVRPGPTDSGMTKEYIKRKHGEDWERIHPIYEDITKDTYGELVYQEQISQIISRMAGMSDADADSIRRVIGKKRDPIYFEPYKKQFIAGCLEQKTFSKKEAEEFWEGLLRWSRYGFNKCLSGDTLLTKSSYNQYTGKHIKISDLYKEWNQDTNTGKKYRRVGLQILQMCDDGRCRPGVVVGVYYQGKKNVYEIKTESGKTIKGTHNHKLFSFDGYQCIEDLKIGDMLAVIQGVSQKTITEKRGQKWKKTNTKGKVGFQTKENNPAYIDGRQKCLIDAKDQVLKRSKGICEKCKGESGNNNFEFSHIISPVEEFNGDYSEYHNKNNILYLCNSCHKKLDYQKGERKKRYSNGYPIYYDKITSIKQCKKEDVFDIEMEGPFHNFVANDIISHNSHSTAYGLIAYRTAYLKAHYPVEFICASLTHGEYKEKSKDIHDRKQHMINEAMALGLSVMPPKIKISEATRWIAKDKTLYSPFCEIKTFGESNAIKCIDRKVTGKPKNTGFFNINPVQKKKTKIDEVLEKIEADNPKSIPDNLDDYLYFKCGIARKRNR